MKLGLNSLKHRNRLLDGVEHRKPFDPEESFESRRQIAEKESAWIEVWAQREDRQESRRKEVLDMRDDLVGQRRAAHRLHGKRQGQRLAILYDECGLALGARGVGDGILALEQFAEIRRVLHESLNVFAPDSSVRHHILEILHHLTLGKYGQLSERTGL